MEEQLAEQFAEVLERLDSGERVTPTWLAAEYPGWSRELREMLALEGLIATGGAPVPDRIGPYRVLRAIGSGGMGSVYLAEIEGFVRGLARGAEAAVKVIHPHLRRKASVVERFLREARIGMRVRHRNVVRTIDAGEAGNLYLAMEYVRGQTLHSLRSEMDHVPEELCRHIGLQIARGLRAIHAEGVVHRDIKPENVIITPDETVKIMDLGVAHLTEEVIRLSRNGEFVGSLLYAAPEQLAQADDIDGRADLYALGLVLYELATGSVTPDGGPQDGISAPLQEILHTLLSPGPRERFASADELIGALAAAPLRRRGRVVDRPIRRETALFGRDRELSELEAAFEGARRGEGQALVVQGPAGVGKSRLVGEFIERVRLCGEPVHVLAGSYPPGGAATAAVVAAFREHIGAGVERVRPYLARTPALLPAFLALLREEDPPADAQPLSQEALSVVLADIVAALARERPTIVWIEDLHFAPEEGRALFASLARASRHAGVFVIGTARSDAPHEIARMTLGRLHERDVGALAGAFWHPERLAPEVVQQVHRLSEGNPLFVIAWLRSLWERGGLVRGPGGAWELAGDPCEVPSEIGSVILDRVRALDRAGREILEAASCCGYEFDARLLADALGRGLVAVSRELAHVEEHHRLVRSSGAGFTFDHHYTHEVIYDAVDEATRLRTHGSIALALERRGGPAVAICHHFLLANRGPDALPYLEKAFRHLEANQLVEASAALASRVLSVPGLLRDEARVRVLLKLSAQYHQLWRLDAQRRALDELRAIADRDGDPRPLSAIQVQLGWLAWGDGRYDEAREAARQALALAHRARAADLEIQAVHLLAALASTGGAYHDARSFFRRAFAVARRTGDPEKEVAALSGIAGCYFNQGRVSRARALWKRAYEKARAVGARMIEIHALCHLGLTEFEAGHWADARSLMDKSLDLAVQSGFQRARTLIIGELGELDFALGRLFDARAGFERQLALSREIRFPLGEAAALCRLGRLYTILGLPETGREHLERARSAFERLGIPRWEARVLHELALAEDLGGDPGAAARHIDACIRMRRAQGEHWRTGFALIDRARMRGTRADIEEAERLECEITTAQALAHTYRTVDASSWTEHEPHLSYLRRMEARMHLWKVLGDRAHLREAQRLLFELREHAPEEHRESLMRNVPLHREIARS